LHNAFTYTVRIIWLYYDLVRQDLIFWFIVLIYSTACNFCGNVF